MSLDDAAQVLRASYAALPSPADMDGLITQSRAAEARGYYDPLEDEHLREAYARYLGIRAAIWQMIRALRPQFVRFDRAAKTPEGLRAFGLAFCGAEIIVRTGEYLIGLARERDIVWQKLDEAEPRYGLKRKNFTRLYRQLTSAFRMHGFYTARDYYDAHAEAIHSALAGADMADITQMLETLNLPSAPRGEHLRRYRNFLNFSLRRRGLSTARKTMFVLFDRMGSDIAEMKIPLIKQHGAPKRVTPEIIAQLKGVLQPGDVFITRHDDAMSNLFLPGFWPHGALYTGPQKTNEKTINILEAKKDGVLLRPIEETLQVDAFVLLRPKLTSAQITEALSKGLSHAGKLYDFIFDFSTSDRLVCTEVIYRAYHGVGDIHFTLSSRAGRKCLSAEDFLNQAIANDWFEPVMIYGVPQSRLIEGDLAKSLLRQSFASNF